MPLSRFTARNVGVSATPLNSTPVPDDKTWTVIGLSICNKLSQTIAVDCWINDGSGANTYVMKSFNVPAGETIFPWGQVGKVVLLGGDTIQALANAANAFDAIMPYYQENA